MSISNKKAWREYPEKAKKAAEKEKAKYAKAQVYEEEAVDWRDAKRNEPAACFVLLAMIWTWAYTELGDELTELECRLCAMGDQQRYANGAVVAGIGEDEHLWCVPPSLWQTRVFEICQGLLGNDMQSEDFKAAYLQAFLRGPPVYARIPIEMESESGFAILRSGGIPVHRVYKAIYGLKRAGQDWMFHANERLEKKGFVSLRSICDGSPSQFVRKVD